MGSISQELHFERIALVSLIFNGGKKFRRLLRSLDESEISFGQYIFSIDARSYGTDYEQLATHLRKRPWIALETQTKAGLGPHVSVFAEISQTLFDASVTHVLFIFGDDELVKSLPDPSAWLEFPDRETTYFGPWKFNASRRTLRLPEPISIRKMASKLIIPRFSTNVSGMVVPREALVNYSKVSSKSFYATRMESFLTILSESRCVAAMNSSLVLVHDHPEQLGRNIPPVDYDSSELLFQECLRRNFKLNVWWLCLSYLRSLVAGVRAYLRARASKK